MQQALPPDPEASLPSGHLLLLRLLPPWSGHPLMAWSYPMGYSIILWPAHKDVRPISNELSFSSVPQDLDVSYSWL